MSTAVRRPQEHITLDLEHPVSCRNLQLAYGRKSVLLGVDLDIQRGEVVGLIGRNGAGKSTLLNCLLGLLKPDQGHADIMGGPALRLDDDRKTRLGYVPQQPQAFGWMQISELFRYLAQLYPQWDRTHAATMLDRWQLDPKQVISKLSPGQAQRLALVRALVPRPDLLILDEPASALDPVARRELLREIVTQAADTHTTVLFSSHIVSDLERVASRVVFLHDGRILLDSALDDIKDNVVRMHVPATIADMLDATLPGELARHAAANGMVTLVLTSPSQQLQDLLQREGVRSDKLGLEDLFVEIAG